MFNTNQIKALNQELNSNRIKTREKGNINLSYLEGFDIIETANTIFGFGNWNYLVSSLTQVSQEQNHNQNFVVCYKAVVKLIVKDENHAKSIFRQDVGFGTGTSKTLADSHENAGKEAVTDALKRAMRSFGNQFGNSLYDKTRNHQSNDSSNQQNSNNYQKSSQYQQQQSNQNLNQRNTTKTSFNQFEYQSLYNLGLNIIEQNGFLIVTGENQYSYRDAIKASGFRFDSKSKSWYKPIEQGAA
ncbi:RAD52 family DNA repair protein [Aliarcobacter butzleri]|uniref:RAD52 family DNA repair protein n=1 Tax=Aliarcobacter butzleri TaxID=28197 RepID=UPI00263ED5CD|nr:RAD52 family DNA repair protein [Aliarcobacter butzleri]MDN5048594.1 RAD52 family DNA repair protein [Aliarcobacter butzleri]MDN5056696.1 RAD52 family DNA repair protein [Aliarcobacter butzleri]